MCMSVCEGENKMERKREGRSVCVFCQRSDVIGVSCLTLLEEAGSVERGGQPVSPVFSQASAHENLFRWVQYDHLNRYPASAWGHLSQSKTRSPSQPLQQFWSLTLSFNKRIKGLTGIQATFNKIECVPMCCVSWYRLAEEMQLSDSSLFSFKTVNRCTCYITRECLARLNDANLNLICVDTCSFQPPFGRPAYITSCMCFEKPNIKWSSHFWTWYVWAC